MVPRVRNRQFADRLHSALARLTHELGKKVHKMSLETTKVEYREKCWKEGNTGWHTNTVHKQLIKFAHDLLRGRPNLRVFLPMCGKSPDIVWLADQGHEVVGVEFAKQPIEGFFSDNSITFTVDSIKMAETAESMDVYKCIEKQITIFHCDLFSVTEKDVGGKFDAIWDRGSLSAIAPSVGDRGKLYTDKMYSFLSPDGRYLLESHRYDVDRQGKPPANITQDHLNQMYQEKFFIKELGVEELKPDPTRRLPFVITRHYHLFTPKGN